MLADKTQAEQVIEREESGDRARMREADFPEEMVQPVGHKTERRHFLLGCNLGDVLAELLFAFACVARRPLGFDHGQHAAVGMVETEIGEAVPGGRIVAL